MIVGQPITRIGYFGSKSLWFWTKECIFSGLFDCQIFSKKSRRTCWTLPLFYEYLTRFLGYDHDNAAILSFAQAKI